MENIFQGPFWSSRENFYPFLLWNDILRGQDTPVRAVICFKPLEIIDLIPLIRGREFGVSLQRVNDRSIAKLTICNLGVGDKWKRTYSLGIGEKLIPWHPSIIGRLLQCR